MSWSLRVSLIVGVLLYLVILFILLRKKSMSLKYALLWIVSGFVLIILAIFPTLLTGFAGLLGIELPSNAIFVVSIALIILILMSLTSIVSFQNEKIKRLIQNLAILEKRVRDLEDKNL